MREIPSWTEYFMGLAIAASLRSKDPETQVGAVIIDENKHLIASGYNGMPAGMEEDASLWERPAKYDYVCHAELNAISHATSSVRNGTLFCTMFPCKECAKLIAANKLKQVFYKEIKYDNEVTRDIFRRCGIVLTKI